MLRIARRVRSGTSFAVFCGLGGCRAHKPRVVRCVESPLGKQQSNYEEILELARGGSAAAVGPLFDQCRGYLLMMANYLLDDRLRAKMGGSDLVQQTLMHAYRDFGTFRGRSKTELLAWLQRILINQAARAKRDYLETAQRDVSREVAFGHKQASRSGGSWLVADSQTPSHQAMAREDHARLQEALGRLSEACQRVIELRNRDQLTFAEIGARMSLSAESARRLWSQAVERLRRELAAGNDT